ncbi:ADP-ribosylglycohydrolase family protein [Gallaecimonas xiamenensis]|uniref:ADP-ribosylglycohydrolase family protein n=1 Tax=Gallaecimonas xiamenensis TaxID=1207039 RepID=UPI000A047E03
MGLAIGDAYGAGFKFKDEVFVRERNTLTQYYDHKLGMVSDLYTDDTQMSLALYELLLPEEAWSPENIAEYFVRSYTWGAPGIGKL